MTSRAQTLTAIVEQALGPLKPLLEDDQITDIMILGNGRVYVEENGEQRLWPNLRLSDGQRRAAAQSIARSVDQEVDEDRPLLSSARLPEGHRVAITFPPVSAAGVAITIRKFRQHGFTLDQLAEAGALTRQQSDWLARAVTSRANILVSGQTGSGKTTLVNSLLRYATADRLILLEDPSELQVPEDANALKMEAKMEMPGSAAITVRHLVMHSLRNNPRRLIIGEIRGVEAFDFIQAMHTGHGGAMATIHAGDPIEALTRLIHLAKGARETEAMPFEHLASEIASAVGVVVQMGRQDGRRVVQAIARPKWENGEFGVAPMEIAMAG